MEVSIKSLNCLFLKGSFFIISLFLINSSFGFDVNQRNAEGETPLHVASRRGDIEFVKLLLGSGADVNARDRYGDTPLHSVSDSRGDESEDVIELLLQYGAER
ncbi:MAG: ankyrin repeat domain-containing protein [Bdellovibrionales bacterium]|nr:ankyrin repeat domain-containing protein [Bdellovibrionales bacterium]